MGLVLAVLLLIAVVSDLSTRRIPNWLTFGAALAGVMIQWRLGAVSGVGFAVGGFVVGLACFLPSYLFGALGGGDVKLMAAAGCFLGPWATLVAALAATVAGGVLALGRIALRGGLPAWAMRYGTMLTALIATHRFCYVAPSPGEPAAERFPYAVAIATGAVVSMVWAG
jgi:prepilin peptidase CpaA